MLGKTWLLPAALVLVLATSGPARDNKQKKEPAGMGPYLTQLHKLFKSWDLNGDGYLDKDELAKAFRGANAKPYDYQPPVQEKEKPVVGPPEKAILKDTDNKETGSNKDKGTGTEAASAGSKASAAEAMTYADRAGPKENFTVALYKDEGREPTYPSSTIASKTAPRPDYSRFPDYNFLRKLDRDGDEKISKDEFDSWAREYAVHLKKQADALKRITHAEERLARATKAAEKRTLESELKQEREALSQLNREMKAFEKVNQLLKGK